VGQNNLRQQRWGGRTKDLRFYIPSHMLDSKYVARLVSLLVILSFLRICSLWRLIVAADTPLIWAISLVLAPFLIMLQMAISVGVREWYELDRWLIKGEVISSRLVWSISK
jgi:hypothetical protein